MVMILENRPSLSEGDLPKDGLNRRSAGPKWQKRVKTSVSPGCQLRSHWVANGKRRFFRRTLG
jgi:hypothetical protein